MTTGSDGKVLEHKITIYVPSTTNVNQPLDKAIIEQYVERTEDFLLGLFGGSTTSPGSPIRGSEPSRGRWISDSGVEVSEDITLVWAFTDDLPAEKRKEVFRFCENLRDELVQDVILVEIDAKAYFI